MIYRPINELKKLENNPRYIKGEDMEKLKKSIKDNPDYFEARPLILSNRTGELVILGGNQRWEAARQIGLEQVPTHLIEDLTEDREREIIIRDNVANGDWDYDALANEWDEDLLDDWGVHLPKDDADPDDQPDPSKKLTETFIAPPFTVLDARQGYWKIRKDEWKSLGMRSELGRDTGALIGSLSGAVPDYYAQKTKVEKELGRKLSNKEFETDYLDAGKFAGGFTSIFDPVLTEIAYTWFNVDNGTILDPFAGGSVRGIVASRLGYTYKGHELSAAQVKENRKQAAEICKDYPTPTWVEGDSNVTIAKDDSKVDMIFTCPPYADLEVYSKDPADISNMEYDQFLEIYRSIIAKSAARLNDNRFATIVIGEVRDKRGIYRNFIGDTIKAFQDAGLSYYNEMILVTVAGSLPIRAGRAFQATRKAGKNHQNMLTFYKGDIEQISDHFANTREAENQHANILTFYKGDPSKISQYFPEIDVSYDESKVDEVDGETA